MQITSAPSAMADLLAPSAAPAESRASSDGGASSADAATFTAMLSARMDTAAPTSTRPAVDGEVDGGSADGTAVEREDETILESSSTASDATPMGVDALHAQPMDALHYGLRTDAQLGRLADELGNGAARAQETHDDGAAASRTAHGSAASVGWSASGAAERRAVRDATRDATRDAARELASREGASATPNPSATGSVAGDAARIHAGTALDVSAPDPALQERLTRVVDRMRDEFGYEIEIVEASASQTGRDALPVEGRPRPVVTGTRGAQDSLGRAVDVDGSWENTEAFQLLQRIAREEGLRALGPREAGHPEPGRHTATPHEGADAPVAETAHGSDVIGPGAAPVLAAAAQAAARESAGQSGETHGTRVARGPRPGTPAARRDSRDEEARSEGEPLPGLAASTPASAQTAHAPERAAPMLGAAAVERLTRVTDRIEAGTAGRNLSHITLRIDNAAGGQDQIRIDLRGLAVDTQIAVADAGTAERMADRMGELRDALGRRGLSADSVSISATRARAADTATAAPSDASRAAATVAAGAARDAGAGSGGSQQSSSQQKQEHAPTPRDAARDTTRDTTRDAQQHGSRDGRRGRDAEPWFTDDAPAAGRVRGRTR